MARLILALALAASAVGMSAAQGIQERSSAGVKKMSDLVIYRDDMYYAAFPSLVVRPSGEVICAFRRAPDRRALWKGGLSHTDSNSYLVLVRSRDAGKTWTNDPELIFAHPLGGSQDPCIVQLKDGSIVCSSYGWALLPSQTAEDLKDSLSHPPYAFLGGYIVRSDDGAKTWKGPFVPPHVDADGTVDALGKPTPAYNRGAMMQGRDGRLYWAVCCNQNPGTRNSTVQLLTSSDRGETWQYACPIAEDSKASFNETSLVETKKGDIVAFMRTANYDDHLAVGRSADGGKSFKWEDGKIVGHPYHALKLKDGRVLLVYGYRHQPYGIRARLLNADCTDIADAPELVIRDDGGNGDIGYPWAALLPDGNILVAYYFNQKDGTRHIAGSILSVE